MDNELHVILLIIDFCCSVSLIKALGVVSQLMETEDVLDVLDAFYLRHKVEILLTVVIKDDKLHSAIFNKYDLQLWI